ncbi:hypothetical protein GBAR_LOCUS11208, partial [Geodia barretti]
MGTYAYRIENKNWAQNVSPTFTCYIHCTTFHHSKMIHYTELSSLMMKFIFLSLFVANGRGKTSVGARQSVHRRDSAREHSEVERSREQG